MPKDNLRFSDETAESSDGGFSRRKMMATGAAVWATASIAGCQDTADPTATEAPATDEPTEEPTATPEPETPTYVVTDEMATAAAFGVSFASSCSPTRLFAPGMRAVWEINVYDPETGENLTDDALESVVVNVDGGPELEAEWIGDAEEHPAPIWDTNWVIPDDAELGEWTYTIEVEAMNDANVRTVGRATGSFIVQADEMPDFYVSTETYWNGSPDDLPDGTNGFVGTCAPEMEFFQSMDPTFQVEIYETETGLQVGAPMPEDMEIPEGDASAAKISGTTVEGVTVSFPDGPFPDMDLEWISGIGDDHGDPHWEATLDDAPFQKLPVGTYTWQIDILGVNEEEDVMIVGAAADEFTVIEK